MRILITLGYGDYGMPHAEWQYRVQATLQDKHVPTQEGKAAPEIVDGASDAPTPSNEAEGATVAALLKGLRATYVDACLAFLKVPGKSAPGIARVVEVGREWWPEGWFRVRNRARRVCHRPACPHRTEVESGNPRHFSSTSAPIQGGLCEARFSGGAEAEVERQNLSTAQLRAGALISETVVSGLRGSLVAAAALPTVAKAESSHLTCTATIDAHREDLGPRWEIAVAGVIGGVVLIAAFFLGRWTASRRAIDMPTAGDPWTLINEEIEGTKTSSTDSGELGSQDACLLTKEVASQAPCTYTVLRGHAKGRFLPLPELAHG